MGQNQSLKTDKNIDNLADQIEDIASSFIFRPSFQDLTKLYSKDYCDKLVVITQQIISRKLNRLEIEYLKDRVENGISKGKETTKERIIYMSNDDLVKLDEPYPMKSKVCQNIAIFYIKCAHIFAAISKTINPVFEYENNLGEIEHVDDKNLIPRDREYKRVYYNFCTRRISAVLLTPNRLGNLKTNICELNRRNEKNGKYKNKKIHSDKLEHLGEEYGITTLEELYYDMYNFETNTFDKMSKESHTQYISDVRTLNNAIHNGKPPNANALTFSDIELIPYHKKKLCTNGELRKGIPLVKDSQEFIKYGKSMNVMIQRSKAYQKIFLGHLNKICIKIEEPTTTTGKKANYIYKLNPELTMDDLNKLVKTVRKDIVNSYLECQEDFNGLKEQLFDIVLKKFKRINEMREQQLEQELMK